MARKSGAGPVRVLIADDHAILRRGLRQIIEETEDLEVVGAEVRDVAPVGVGDRHGERDEIDAAGETWPRGIRAVGAGGLGSGNRGRRGLLRDCRRGRQHTHDENHKKQGGFAIGA